MSATKYQTDCYRIINGTKYMNWMDLIQGEIENNRGIEEAKKQFSKIKRIKHWKGEYYQLFVAK